MPQTFSSGKPRPGKPHNTMYGRGRALPPVVQRFLRRYRLAMICMGIGALTTTLLLLVPVFPDGRKLFDDPQGGQLLFVFILVLYFVLVLVYQRIFRPLAGLIAFFYLLLGIRLGTFYIRTGMPEEWQVWLGLILVFIGLITTLAGTLLYPRIPTRKPQARTRTRIHSKSSTP